MSTVVQTTFKLKRGTSALWNELNPVLAQGEPGFAYDTNELKIGDGYHTWIDLPYISGTNISPDGSTLAYDVNGDLTVIGFEDAQAQQIPMKDEHGNLIWYTLSAVATSGLIDDLSQKNTLYLYCGSASELVGED